MTSEKEVARTAPYRPGYEAAAERILQLIAELELRPGDRMPTENELAALMGTSRTVVREAVKILSAIGRVRALKGRGLDVADDEGMLGSSRWGGFFLPTGLDHVYLLFEFRRAQETAASRLAAADANPAELRTIEVAAETCRLGCLTGRAALFDRSTGPTTISTSAAQFTRNDEWYDFRTNPPPTVHVLTTVDESTSSGGTMGADHPNTWCHNFDGGRAWYTGMGHTIENFSEPNFLHLMLGGIQTAAGAVPANCAVATPPPPSGKQMVGTQSGRCVDVPGSSTANGTRMQLLDCGIAPALANQLWTYTASKQFMVYGNKFLDANGQGTANGTQVIIWDCNGRANQQWTQR